MTVSEVEKNQEERKTRAEACVCNHVLLSMRGKLGQTIYRPLTWDAPLLVKTMAGLLQTSSACFPLPIASSLAFLPT